MSASRYTVDDPATGEVWLERELATLDQALAVVHASAAAQRELAKLDVEARAALIDAFADRILARLEPIARDITRQMGKPIAEARGEVRTMVDRARTQARLAPAALATRELPKDGFLRRIVREPLGVVLDVPAWNYPLLTAVNVIVPAVLAGNGVVVKHSRRTPLCAEHFADAFRDAGAPAGLVGALDADHAVTAQVMADPAVGYVGFTGSVGGGREVYRSVAAQRFIDCGLELGGKDPAYVRADADVDVVAPALAEGAFYNTGQSCCAIERIYVAEGRYAEFVERFVAAVTETYRPGPPLEDATTQGALAQESGLGTLEAQVADARARGARVVLGGSRTAVAGRGRYFEPTVVVDAPQDALVMAEESFGPIIALAPVRDDEDAVRRMNDSAYGLTASIWSKDVDASLALAARVEAGTVFLNRCDYLDPELPWTGYKDSGKGSTLSEIGITAFTRPKSIHFRLPG